MRVKNASLSDWINRPLFGARALKRLRLTILLSSSTYADWTIAVMGISKLKPTNTHENPMESWNEIWWGLEASWMQRSKARREELHVVQAEIFIAKYSTLYKGVTVSILICPIHISNCLSQWASKFLLCQYVVITQTKINVKMFTPELKCWKFCCSISN